MNEKKPIYVTQEGLEALKAELDELINVRRPALAERLRFAIKQGDLSENADYIAAKEEQGFLEGRIRELQEKIRQAEVIEERCGADGEVTLGCHVTVVEEGRDETETYHMVGATEANPGEGKISNESPLGQALMGHKVGDKVTVRAPVGSLRFEIVEVR
ncbi:MAG: transcription elongation factor GreA [Anaerolineae bacterium]